MYFSLLVGANITV